MDSGVSFELLKYQDSLLAGSFVERLKKPRARFSAQSCHLGFVVTTKTREGTLLGKEVTHHIPVLDLFLVLGLMSLGTG